jgi:hypothetical protein
MPRDFNVNLNKTILETNVVPENFATDEGMNDIMQTADEIIEVFAKRKTSMEDAWLILASLADSIYMYATTGEDI